MTGKIVWRGENAVYFLDGEEVTKQRFERAFPPQPLSGGSNIASIKPKLSDALAVHPKQVQEATESAKRHGVPTEFTADGRPIIRSRQHQKDYLRAYGFVNKDGGYGD